MFQSTNQAASKIFATTDLYQKFVVPKIFEKIVRMPIITKCLCEIQHGFSEDRSTITNLILFSNFIHKNFTNRLQTDITYALCRSCQGAGGEGRTRCTA